MKLYTKTGDKGETSLVSGQRVSKAHPRIEAYGTVDELNSFVGLLRAYLNESGALPKDEMLLSRIQHCLFNCGAYLATDSSTPQSFVMDCGITDEDISMIESAIDRLDEGLPAMRAFILPAGGKAASVAHICRTVARRGERCIYRLMDEHPGSEVDKHLLVYINRLSDYFFILARATCYHLGVGEVVWQAKP